MEGRRRELEVGEGDCGQKEERALMAHLLSPAASRQQCSTQGLARKEKDGKRRAEKEGERKDVVKEGCEVVDLVWWSDGLDRAGKS